MKYAIVATLAVLLSRCTLGPDFTPPRPQTPASFTTENSPGQNSRFTTGQADEGAWWARFQDSELSALIQNASADNFDVRTAVLRIAEAREQLAVAEGDRYPMLGGNTSYARQRISRTTAQGSLFNSFGSLDSVLPPGAAASLPRFPNPYDQFQAGFDASWEPDLFGRVRRSVEAAGAEMRATLEDSHDVLVSLASEVARRYIDLRGAQQKLTIARDNLATERDILLLAQQRRQAGLTNEIDVHNAAAQATATESQIPQLERQIDAEINQLGLLLGREPGALRAELVAEKPVPPVPPEIAVGLPGDLLRRRPDIRAAEARLHAATARIGVATADLFPRVTLSAQFGTQSETVAGLANWASRFLTIGPALQVPIFEGGKLQANLRLTDVREQEAAVGYAKTVVGAMHDVQDALVAVQDEEQRHDLLTMTVGENRIAAGLARDRYVAGLTTFLDVLDADRRLQQNESMLADSTAALSTDAVAVYKALGGGWQEPGELRVGSDSR